MSGVAESGGPTPSLATPLRLRVPLTLALCGLGVAIVTVAAPAYPGVKQEWLSVAFAALLAGYLALSAGVVLWSSARSAISPRVHRLEATTAAPCDASRHRLAALVLACAVVAEAAAHSGERSPSWFTSRPTIERQELGADGYAAWIEGQPVHGEALYTWDQVKALSHRAPTIATDFRQGIARTGHGVYAFLIALVVRITGPFGSVYAAYLIVNALSWWIGTLAIYDLARRAADSWWVGLTAGLLTATGIGFAFTAGGLLSTPAAYGAVAALLWLVERLRVFAPDARLVDLAVSACLVAGASLLYSLTVFFIAFFVVALAGRLEWRRLLAMAAIALLIGQVWSRLWDFVAAAAAGGGESFLAMNALPLGTASAAAVAALSLVWLPRGVGERLAALLVLGVVTAVAVAAGIIPNALLFIGNAATATLQLPRYVGDFGKVFATFAGPYVSGLPQTIEALSMSNLAPHFAAAFPLTLGPFAVTGVVRLRRRWLDWCLALVAIAAVQTLGMNAATGAPHPRLMYYCFPAVYLLAACGALNAYAGFYWLSARGLHVPLPVARGAALLVVAMLLAPVLFATNASLWGDAYFDMTFHFLD